MLLALVTVFLTRSERECFTVDYINPYTGAYKGCLVHYAKRLICKSVTPLYIALNLLDLWIELYRRQQSKWNSPILSNSLSLGWSKIENFSRLKFNVKLKQVSNSCLEETQKDTRSRRRSVCFAISGICTFILQAPAIHQ